MASLLEYPQATPFSLKVCFGLNMSYMRYTVYRLHFQNALVLVILNIFDNKPYNSQGFSKTKNVREGKAFMFANIEVKRKNI